MLPPIGAIPPQEDAPQPEVTITGLPGSLGNQAESQNRAGYAATAVAPLSVVECCGHT
jgi:hypothetical protein